MSGMSGRETGENIVIPGNSGSGRKNTPGIAA